MDRTTEPQVAGADAGVPPGRALLAIACVSTLVVNANTSAVSILLPSISADLGMSTEVLQWAVTGYRHLRCTGRRAGPASRLSSSRAW